MSDQNANFRQQATLIFGWGIVALVVLAIGSAGLGWKVGRWWGLAIGAGIGIALLVVGLVGGGLIWAMTQDGG